MNKSSPHPVPLPIGWGEGGWRPGEGLTFVPTVYAQSVFCSSQVGD